MTRDDEIHFGACWHPERWPETRSDEDLRLMAEAGFTCVRWGEELWGALEPEPGERDWALLDRILARCAERGLGVILVVPTDGPPAWFDAAHGEARRGRHGEGAGERSGRRRYDPTDPDYRGACRSLVADLAARYAADERVWAWQIGADALTGGLLPDRPRRLQAFRYWLRERYGDIAALNRAWGHRGAADGYPDFDAIGPGGGEGNPQRQGDLRRWYAEQIADFLREQAAAIRAVAASARIVIKEPGEGVACVDLLTDLGANGVLGVEHFPVCAGDPSLRPAAGMRLGHARQHARRLWVIEQQSGQVGGAQRCLPTSPPGELSVAALQAIGHGSDLLTWWPWRTPISGIALNTGGLLAHWGDPSRHYDECRDLVTALRRHAALLAATRPQVAVARIHSPAQALAVQVEPWLAGALEDPANSGRQALLDLGLNENRVAAADLRPGDGYAVALMPLAVALSEDDVENLADWVAAGGNLVVGPMAGYRDHGGIAPGDGAPPGPLARLTGTRNPEGTTSPEPVTILAADGGQQIRATRYAEIIEPVAADAALIARHSTGWLATRGAVVERPWGQGRVVHCGVGLTADLLEWLWVDHVLPRPKPAVLTHERSAETLTRIGDGYAVHFTLNHGPGPAVFYLYRQVADLLSGELVSNSYTLTGYGWRVLCEEFGGG